MSIRIFVTGGTIDKTYNIESGELEMADTHVRIMLLQARNLTETEIEVVSMKVSSKFNRDDIRHLIDSCQQAEEDKIIITHGTDTLNITSKKLSEAGINKTIILTGAVIPYIMEKSDALFNLGCAITAAQILPFGVYTTMNGLIFESGNFTKDKATGIFSALD